MKHHEFIRYSGAKAAIFDDDFDLRGGVYIPYRRKKEGGLLVL
ncbi:hypothetical protein [Paenibacillus germinis]|nr:hypothetical protein [Paenibacillus germinis]